MRFKTQARRPPFTLRPLPFIRDYLASKGRASISEVWREYGAMLKARGYEPPQYQTFVKYFNILKRLGLVVVVGRAPSSNPNLVDRVIYSLAPGAERSPLWNEPVRVLQRRASKIRPPP